MKFGLIGEKLSHSFSAQIHNRLFDYEYTLCELTADQFCPFMLDRDFDAINVTIPYKEAVLPYLDVVDDVAMQIGAVNTVVNRNGKLHGYNTDFEGLRSLVERSGIPIRDKKVLILGSGGTSKTAETTASLLGCSSVWRVSRTARDGCISYVQAKREHADAQVIINTTPCGMHPLREPSPIMLDDYPSLIGVVDVVYNPLRTQLVCDALSRGIPAVGGLYMLVKQAANAAELFVGDAVPTEKVDDIYRHLYADKENIVLVGMPGCGKTTVGKQLAALMNRPFIDTDDLIVTKNDCAISDIFQQVGECGFRDIESEVINDVSRLQGAVIATGGGAVLRSDNVQLLKENGRLYFLDRPLAQLDVTSDRPLSSTREDLEKRYHERYAVYTAVCDAKIQSDCAVEDVANLIREDFLYEHFGDQRT